MDTRRDFIFIDDLVDVRDEGDRRRGPQGRLPHLVRRRLRDQGAVRRDGEGARHQAGQGRRGPPRGTRTTPSRSCSTRPRRTRTSAGRSTTPLADGRRRRTIEYYRAATASTADLHPPQAAGRSATEYSKRVRDDASINVDGTTVLVVGGAGFVGSNLVRALLAGRRRPRCIVVDNLLSAERANVPDDPRVEFIEGSIADDAVLRGARGRPTTTSSTWPPITATRARSHDPLADHENNTLTTLKLYERLKELQAAEEGRLLRGRLHRRREDVRRGAARPTEDAPVSL